MKFKNILFFSCVLFCLQAISGNQLTVKIENCELHSADTSMRFFQLYERLKMTDSSIQMVDSRGISEYTFNDLKHGTYLILFPNKFNDVSRVEFEFREDLTVTLCPNRYQNDQKNHLPIINQLEPEETYQINFRSTGCFHLTLDSITVGRKTNGYFISYNNKPRLLTPPEIKIISEFEVQLNSIPQEYTCTTIEYYSINYKGVLINFNDNSCDWHGWQNLLSLLKLKKE